MTAGGSQSIARVQMQTKSAIKLGREFLYRSVTIGMRSSSSENFFFSVMLPARNDDSKNGQPAAEMCRLLAIVYVNRPLGLTAPKKTSTRALSDAWSGSSRSLRHLMRIDWLCQACTGGAHRCSTLLISSTHPLQCPWPRVQTTRARNLSYPQLLVR